MSTLDHQFVLEWLMEQTGPEVFKEGLSRLRQMLRGELELVRKKQKQGKLKIITVGGTNGKGSSVAILSSLAQAQGIRWSAFFSPHVVSICERLQDNNASIEAETLYGYFLGIKQRCDEFDVALSFYEYLFCAWVQWSLESNVSLMLCEVGLGGRLDAANVFDADGFLLTSISRDHQAQLGNRYELILKEKWGIAREDQLVVSGLETNYLRRKMNEWHLPGQRITNFRRDQLFDSFLESLRFQGEENPTQAKNYWCCAHLFAQVMKCSLRKCVRQMQNLSPIATFLGRGDRLTWDNSECLIWGAHNPDGVRRLCQLSSIQAEMVLFAPSKRAVADLVTMMKSLSLRFPEQQKHVLSFKHPRSMSSAEFTELKQQASQCGLEGQWSFREKGLSWAPLLDSFRGNVLIVGSFYFLGEFYQTYMDRNAMPVGRPHDDDMARPELDSRPV